MPEVLHESTGLRIVKNDTNRFCIASLHYTADPAKRSKLWKQEAMAGMPPARWAKEYEIDYTALYGQRVFPEIASGRDRIVIQEPYKEYGPLQPFWGGFDFGQRNPSAFYVFTIDDGVMVAVYEIYEPCKSVEDLAGKITSCPYYSQLKYIACDPTIVNQKSRTNKFGEFVSLAELFRQHGVRGLIPGNTDEATWLGMMRQHWRNPEDPTFRIRACCPNMIVEFENAVFSSQSDRDVLTQTYKESIEDVHNHAMDATKYWMNTRPANRVRHWKDPQQWRKWVK
jgi:hypothetical protein